MGRQARRLRRPRPAVGNQVLHPQLLPRRRAQGPQPAHRPRSLRKDHPPTGPGTWPRRCSCASPPARIPPQSARRRAPCPHCTRPSRSSSPLVPGERPARSPSTAGTSTATSAPCRSVPRHYHGQGCRAVLQPPHRRGRMGPGQQRRQDAALALPAPVRRCRGSAQPCRPVARDGRAVPPPAQPTHPAAGIGAALLAPGHRDRRAQPCRARRLPLRPLHRHAPRRGAGAALGAGGHERDDVQGRGDRDRQAAGAARHPASRWSCPSPGRRGRSSNAASPRSLFRAVPGVGVSVREQPLGPSPPDAAPERADRRGGRGAVLVPRASQVGNIFPRARARREAGRINKLLTRGYHARFAALLAGVRGYEV